MKKNLRKQQLRGEPLAFVPVVRGANKLEVRAENGAHEIVLIGSVGKNWWDDSGITEKEFRDALKTIPNGKPITISVNSEGGSVQEGLGIYNAIKDRAADITCKITGYALSIASVFPLAAGKVVSPKSAIWMIHKAWSWNQGNADDMRQAAEMLDAHDETLAEIYAEHTGKSKAEILSAMEDETWIKGADAVTWGLADEGDDEPDADDAAAAYRPLAKCFLDRCKNLSPEILNALRPAADPGRAAVHSAAQNGGQQKQPTNNTMNKATIVALLKKHGIEALETESDEQLQAKLETLATKKTQTDSSAQNLTDLAAIRAEMKALKTANIQNRLNGYVDQNRCTKAQAKIYLAQALVNAEQEEAVFAALEETQPMAAGDPVGAHIITVEDGPCENKNGVQGSKILPELDNIFSAHKTAEARYGAMKAQLPRLLQAAFRKDAGVQAANTFSGTVTTNFLIQGVILKLHNRFAAAKLFTRDNSQDPFKPLAAGIMKFNTTAMDGSGVQTNLTDFENAGDSTINAITITPAQYTSLGHLSNSELNSGFRIADIMEAKMVDLAAKLSQVFTAPITTANFVTNAALISAPASFGFSELADLQGTLKKSMIKNLLLDGEYQARIANQPGFFQAAGLTGGNTGAWAAYGWDNIALHTDWSGAGANVRGFACNPQAIGIITGLPLTPPDGIPGNTVQQGVAQLPDVGIGIQTNVWFSARYRTLYFSFDSIAGATLIDETAGRLIKSA